ncbi:MAG: hypothetical protein SFV15_15290 [Polyangiaceae bacterium]|nr:hypothetical protein [Polyangiaceae bacterium]
MFRRRALFAVSLALVGASCLSPTLPLPPPSQPSVQGPDANGQVRLSGTVLPRSQVVAINLRTDEIAGQNTESGSYDFMIRAQIGDNLSFFYITKTHESSPLNLVIRAPQP